MNIEEVIRFGAKEFLDNLISKKIKDSTKSFKNIKNHLRIYKNKSHSKLFLTEILFLLDKNKDKIIDSIQIDIVSPSSSEEITKSILVEIPKEQIENEKHKLSYLYFLIEQELLKY